MIGVLFWQMLTFYLHNLVRIIVTFCILNIFIILVYLVFLVQNYTIFLFPNCSVLMFPMGQPTFVFVPFFTRPVCPWGEEYCVCWSDSTHLTWGGDHVLLWCQLFWGRQWNVWMLHLWEVCPSFDQTLSLSLLGFFLYTEDYVYQIWKKLHWNLIL